MKRYNRIRFAYVFDKIFKSIIINYWSLIKTSITFFENYFISENRQTKDTHSLINITPGARNDDNFTIAHRWLTIKTLSFSLSSIKQKLLKKKDFYKKIANTQQMIHFTVFFKTIFFIFKLIDNLQIKLIIIGIKPKKK